MGIKKIEKRLGFAALAFAVQMLVASEVVSPQLNDFRFNGVNIPSDPELESQIHPVDCHIKILLDSFGVDMMKSKSRMFLSKSTG